jgi:hypothetical protein
MKTSILAATFAALLATTALAQNQGGSKDSNFGGKVTQSDRQGGSQGSNYGGTIVDKNDSRAPAAAPSTNGAAPPATGTMNSGRTGNTDNGVPPSKFDAQAAPGGLQGGPGR